MLLFLRSSTTNSEDSQEACWHIILSGKYNNHQYKTSNNGNKVAPFDLHIIKVKELQKQRQ